ncbi:hypothetical protein [Spirosoma validum]|uniref:Uncharacterized protein n=1 Tax=Spirosoma validum TaxID=2771355 RepID=A0A927GGA5_9BACT|nr:hypothetical protein [Spirosoma validum]MBD2756400.1 hypothetical protein [Spirosoma validum]
MDKASLVKQLRNVFEEIDREGTPIESVYLIPPQLIFKAQSFIVVVSSPTFKNLSIGEQVKKVRELVTPKVDPEIRRHINMIWAFGSPIEAMNRIEQEIGDETYLITPIIEPAHA